jgi:heme/copper-type cytochrome/quinol oxidase subunit 3
MIPYTIERRPDTGVTNVTMGVWLFIASETMLFGALISAYALLRTAAADWPSALPGATAWGNTAILALLTGLVWRGRRIPARARRWLGGATLLGALFVLLQAREYSALIGSGQRPATNTFLATYFALTGLHALHVVFGAAANLWTIASLGRVPVALTQGRIQGLTIYWAFVGVLWLVMVGLFYAS